MTFSPRVTATVVLCLLMLPGGLAVGVSAQATNNQDTAPNDPIIGTWALNNAKSKWVVRRQPLGVRRTFDYTRDGMILVTYEIDRGPTNKAFLHWYLTPDGEEQPEFARSRGKSPLFTMRTTQIDAFTYELNEWRTDNPDELYSTIIFQVSQDRNTLTMFYKNPEGELTDLAVYDRVW